MVARAETGELLGPQFLVEGDIDRRAYLGTGDLDRDRTAEYTRLFEGEQQHSPVLALTIFTANEDGVDKILVGVRDPNTNTIHPNVVSTPTRRINALAFVKIAASAPLVGQDPRQHTFDIDGTWFRTTLDHYNNPHFGRMEIDDMLTNKLGVKNGSGTCNTEIVYRAAKHSVTLGDSRADIAPDGRNVIEKVAMLNILVSVHQAQKDLFTQKTTHYRDLRWVTPEEYRGMQDSKELLPVFDDMAAELCIHGVCIATSRFALDDIQHLHEERAAQRV